MDEDENEEEVQYYDQMLDKIEELEETLATATSDDDAEWINGQIKELAEFVRENFAGLDKLLQRRKKRKPKTEAEKAGGLDDDDMDDRSGSEDEENKRGAKKSKKT